MKMKLLIPDRQDETINRVFMYIEYRKKLIPVRILAEVKESGQTVTYIEIANDQLKKLCKLKILKDRKIKASLL